MYNFVTKNLATTTTIIHTKKLKLPGMGNIFSGIGLLIGHESVNEQANIH